MIKNFLDFLNENNAPDENNESPKLTNNERYETLALIKAIQNGNMNYVKNYFDEHINDKDIQQQIASNILRCMYNNQKDICDYLLNLDVMNNGSITKDGNITNINVDFLFKSFISNAKDLNKPDFLEMIIQQYDRNGVKYPSIYSGKEPIDIV